MAYTSHYNRLDPSTRKFLRSQGITELQPDGELLSIVFQEDLGRDPKNRVLKSWTDLIAQNTSGQEAQRIAAENCSQQLESLASAADNSKQTALMTTQELKNIMEQRTCYTM